MNATLKIACLPVGLEWPPSGERQWNALLAGLPERLSLQRHKPALQEVAVLDRVRQVLTGGPDLLLLAAMHGASARALTLAARKCGIPCAIWCHDEKHSLASATLATEALRQLGHPCLLLHGDMAAAAHDVAMAAAAGAARRALAEARIGQLGPLHHNLISAAVNPLVLEARFGSWVVPLPLARLRERLRGIGQEQIATEITRLRSRYAVNVADAALERATAMHLALKGLAADHRLDALAVDCWNEIMPGFGISPCLGFSGDDCRIACEGDVTLAATLLAGEALSGQPGFVGDLYSLNEETGETVLIHCAGCAALHSASEPMAIAAQPPPGPAGQSGAVVACHPVLRTGAATMVLLHGERLERLHVQRCEITGTDFTDQMRLRVRIAGEGQAFRREAAGNHYVVFPGDWVDAWKLWARWSGVECH